MMLDLFGAPVLPGLSTRLDLIDDAEEREFISLIDACALEPFRFQGWTGKRLTASFGWNYDFETGQQREAPPFPDWLILLRDRAANFAALDPALLVQALVIRYDAGAGIGWHRDRPLYEHVVGISLGEPASMRFRQRRGNDFARITIPLAPRGAYHLSGPARHEWEHSIAEMVRPRWSITFRSLVQTPSKNQPGALPKAEANHLHRSLLR